MKRAFLLLAIVLAGFVACPAIQANPLTLLQQFSGFGSTYVRAQQAELRDSLLVLCKVCTYHFSFGISRDYQ